MPAAMADKVSLSPNLLMCRISETEMVSFSLMMGMTPRESRVESVVVAFRYRERCERGRVASVPAGGGGSDGSVGTLRRQCRSSS